MTLEEAVERVEAGANPVHTSYSCLCSGCSPGAAEALSVVLAAAKRPRVYALGEGERFELEDFVSDAEQFQPPITITKEGLELLLPAIRAALALEQPEEPFTGDELRWFAAWGAACVNDGLNEEKELLAKLRAYIEAMSARQSKPAC